MDLFAGVPVVIATLRQAQGDNHSDVCNCKRRFESALINVSRCIGKVENALEKQFFNLAVNEPSGRVK